MNRIWTWLFWLWTLVFFTLTSYPKLSVPYNDTISWDKLAHLLMYSGLAYLYYRMRKRGRGIIRELLWIALTIPILDEVHQLPIPGRQFSWLDWLADLLGIALIIIPILIARIAARTTDTDESVTRDNQSPATTVRSTRSTDDSATAATSFKTDSES